MLFTRCPDCETTFRVTASALFKAAGKVRCGRCDAIFVADDELSDATISTITESDVDQSAEVSAGGGEQASVGEPEEQSTEDSGNEDGEQPLETEIETALDELEEFEQHDAPEVSDVDAEDSDDTWLAGVAEDEEPEEDAAFEDESDADDEGDGEEDTDLAELGEDEEAEEDGALDEEIDSNEDGDGAEDSEPADAAELDEHEEPDEAAAYGEETDAGDTEQSDDLAALSDDAETTRDETAPGDAGDRPAPSADSSEDQWAAFFARAPTSHDGSAAAENLEAELTDPANAGEFVDDVAHAELRPEQEDGEWDGMTPEEINDALGGDRELESRLAALAEVAQEPEQPTPRSRSWIAAAIVLAIALTLQAAHIFRSDLALNPIVGPLLQTTYASFGVELIPAWDLSQYEILDWDATADPSDSGEGTMSITARIRNNGPDEQPYPSIHLHLKDRWDQTVGSRIFSPNEYLPLDHTVSGLMAAGTTIPAQMDLVDSTEQAYGFELDVCIQSPTGGLTCVADTIFR